MVILVAAAVLAARALLKNSAHSELPADTVGFSALQNGAAQVSQVRELSLGSQNTASTTASPLATQISSNNPSATAHDAATQSDQVAGEEISSLHDLNTIASDTDGVFIYLPGKANGPGKAPTLQMQSAARKIQAQGPKIGVFTLKTGSRDYAQIARQMPVPGVLAVVKGRGMVFISGDITETKLVQGFVGAARLGGCGPAGCRPVGCN